MLKLLRNNHYESLELLAKSVVTEEPNEAVQVDYTGIIHSFEDAPYNTLLVVMNSKMYESYSMNEESRVELSPICGTVFIKLSRDIVKVVAPNLYNDLDLDHEVIYFDSLIEADAGTVKSKHALFGQYSNNDTNCVCIELNTVSINGDKVITEFEKGLFNDHIVHYRDGVIENIIRHDEVAVVVSGVESSKYIRRWKATADREKIIRWTLEGDCQHYIDKITNIAIIEP